MTDNMNSQNALHCRFAAMLVCLAVAIMIQGCSSRAKNVQAESGNDWLRISSRERDAFVHGYLTGRLQGETQACRWAAAIIDENKPFIPGDNAYTHCRNNANAYTRFEYQADGRFHSDYPDLITQMYKMNPAYKDIPYTGLLMHMDDEGARNAEDLSRLIQARVIRAPS